MNEWIQREATWISQEGQETTAVRTELRPKRGTRGGGAKCKGKTKGVCVVQTLSLDRAPRAPWKPEASSSVPSLPEAEGRIQSKALERGFPKASLL